MVGRMKNKISRKLILSTSTIRSLRADALGRVAGAISANMCHPSEVTCLCNKGGSGGSASGDGNCGWSFAAGCGSAGGSCQSC